MSDLHQAAAEGSKGASTDMSTRRDCPDACRVSARNEAGETRPWMLG